jgi:alginate O-acetyltransferase complex protein AlgJ
MKNSANRLCAYVMIFMLLCGPLFFALVVKSSGRAQVGFWPPASAGLVNGAVSSAFDRLYKSEFPLKNFSVSALNALSYKAFHEARKGAIVGKDGWLFSDEEFIWDAGSPVKVDARVAEILKVEAELAARGAALLVILVPQKSTIYPEHLGSAQVPQGQQQLYDSVRQRLLASSHLLLPDVKAALLRSKLHSEVFLKTDTHWRVEGAEAAAKAVADAMPKEQIAASGSLKPEAMLAVDHRGDLLKFIDLGRWESLLPVRTEVIAPIAAKNIEATVDDFLAVPAVDKPRREIALVGTSYSANPLWSFQSQLELALGATVKNYAEEGKGYSEPMRKFLSSIGARSDDVGLVIWEIPVRYLVADQTAAK